VQHEQIPFLDIRRDEQVERLRLIDIGRAVRREFEQPALVDLEAGLERVLLFLAQEIECWTEPPRSRIEFQTFWLSFAFSISSFSR
jgi:hypothetical protein